MTFDVVKTIRSIDKKNFKRPQKVNVLLLRIQKSHIYFELHDP